MRFISTRFHAKLDYLTGVFLIATPRLFGFTESTEAAWVCMIAGGLALTYSIFTDYQGGVIRSIPMRVHLILDVMSGIVLAASPWLFGFADEVYLPHLIIGIFEIAAGMLTSSEAYAHQS